MAKTKPKRISVVYLCASCSTYGVTSFYKHSRDRDGHPHCTQCDSGDIEYMELSTPLRLRDIGLRAALELIQAVHDTKNARSKGSSYAAEDKVKLAFLVSRLCELRDLVAYDSTNWSEP